MEKYGLIGAKLSHSLDVYKRQDVVAKDVLRQAIIDFKGTVILVSHEPEFYQGAVTEVWNIEDWTTKIV